MQISIRNFLCAICLLTVGAMQVSGPAFAGTNELMALLDATEDYHPQLKSLKAELRGARETTHQVAAGYKPNVFLESNVRRSQRDATLQQGGDFSQDLSPQELSVRLNQTVYNGGRKGLQNYGAALQVRSAEARYTAIELSIKSDLVDQYIQYLSVLEQIGILKQNIALLNDVLIATRERVRLGDGTNIEIAQVQTRLAGAKAQLAETQALRQIIVARIKASTGVIPVAFNAPELLIDPTDYDIEIVSHRIRANSASLEMSDLQERLARTQLISESRSHLPTISLQAAAITSRNNGPTIDRDDQLTIGLRLTMPLYTGGQQSSDRRRALSAVTAAKFARQNQLRELELQITEIWHNTVGQDVVLISQQTNLQAAGEAVKGIIAAQKSGLASSTDVLDALEDQLRAQTAVSQTEFNILRSKLLMLLLMGELDRSVSESTNDPKAATLDITNSGSDQ